MFFRNESFKDFIRLYPIVSSLIAINVIIWLLMFLPLTIGNYIWAYGVGRNIWVSAGEYWRLVTPVFLHDPNGVTHILFNSFSLFLFGPALEQMLGKFKFIFVYLFTGIAGNFFTFLVDTNSTTFHLGASGALYGLLGLLVYMSFFQKELIDPISRQIVTTITIVGVIMTFIQPGINIEAHIFGLIAGLALGPVILNNVTPYSPWRNQRRVVRVAKDNDIGFDPNRWNKKRFQINRNVSSILWWIVLILAVIGLLSRFF